MNCPLCSAKLEEYNNVTCIAYECTDAKCLNDDMPRYKMTWVDGKIVTRTIQFDDIHVAIDYLNDTTIVSKLMACFLMNSIRFPKAIEWYDDEPAKTLEKIKLLLTFS